MSKPTTRSTHRVLALVALGLAAAAWVFALTQLWQTSVPGDLSLPQLEPRDYFSASLLDEAEGYERFLRIIDLSALLVLVAVLGLFAAKGARFARESAAGRIGTGMLLGMLGLGLVWLAQLPFGLAEIWWLRRHDTAEIGYLEWLIDDFLLVGGQFVFISAALLVVMGMAGVSRRGWWLLATPVLAGLAVAFTFVQPYLLPDQQAADDGEIAADVREIAAKQGIADPDVRVQDTHGFTEAPNAFAAGLGTSERVVLWDTLVEAFDDPEVRFVLAHEFAHLSRDHVWKTLAWMALLALPIALIVALATRRRGGLHDPAAVPVAIFVVAVLLILLSPLDRSFSKRLEAEADWVALESTRAPDAGADLFEGFARIALLDPSPPAWSSALLDDHPSIMRRLEMVEAWRRR